MKDILYLPAPWNAEVAWPFTPFGKALDKALKKAGMVVSKKEVSNDDCMLITARIYGPKDEDNMYYAPEITKETDHEEVKRKEPHSAPRFLRNKDFKSLPH